MIYALIGCLIVIGFLGYKLLQKQKIDKEELEQYRLDIDTARTDRHLAMEQMREDIRRAAKYKAEWQDYKEKAEYEAYKLEECKKDLQAALDVYQDITENKLKEIDNSMEEQRQKRQQELDNDLQNRKELCEKALADTIRECEEQSDQCKQIAANIYEECNAKIKEYESATEFAASKFAGLQSALKQYEMERQARLFYTIQLPDEYKDDIEFLLTTVAAKVSHPDIISKLVWAEYVKPNLDDTFKRIEIKAEPGIYKITNIDNGKAYIGKSTDVKKRLTDHFKSSIGITSIANQAVHHAIRQTGFWNWSIEIITYCEKDKLSELEKYYIDFFQTNSFGYNKTGGGEG